MTIISTFSNYIKEHLKRSFSKDQFVENLDITLSELKERTIPGYRTALDSFGDYRFTDQETIFLTRQYKLIVGDSKNHLEAITTRLKNTQSNIEAVRRLVTLDASSEFKKVGLDFTNDEIASMGLTYKQATVLRFMDMAQFVTDFARRYLSYFICLEDYSINKENSKFKDYVSDVEVKYIKNNYETFFKYIKIVGIEEDKFIATLSNIVNIIISESDENVVKNTFDSKLVDPFKMGFISTWINPIWYIRAGIANYQVSRAKKAEAELNKLLLQCQQLKVTRDSGQGDAILDKEIKQTEERINDLRYKIHQLERV